MVEPESTFYLVDELRIHAFTSPRGDDTAKLRPVVLVHGLGVSARYFLPMASALGSRFRVFAPDLPGTGRSDRPSRALNIVELATALRAWLDVVGLDRASFVGNSMGCQVLAELAVQAPERIDRLVFIGPTVDPKWRSFLKQIPRWLLAALREPLSLLPILLRDYFRFGPRRFLATGRFALADPLEGKLPRILAPTLVVRGERDALVSAKWADEVAGLLPAGASATVAEAAHAANFSAPKEIADLVESFVGSGWRKRDEPDVVPRPPGEPAGAARRPR